MSRRLLALAFAVALLPAAAAAHKFTFTDVRLSLHASGTWTAESAATWTRSRSLHGAPGWLRFDKPDG